MFYTGAPRLIVVVMHNIRIADQPLLADFMLLLLFFLIACTVRLTLEYARMSPYGYSATTSYTMGVNLIHRMRSSQLS